MKSIAVYNQKGGVAKTTMIQSKKLNPKYECDRGLNLFLFWRS